jgi:hypothetical protein
MHLCLSTGDREMGVATFLPLLTLAGRPVAPELRGQNLRCMGRFAF